MKMRFIKWPFIIVFLLVFSVGYNFVRVFLPSASAMSYQDNASYLDTPHAKQPFQILPSRRALISLAVGKEDISKQYADDGYSLDKNVLHILSVSSLSFSYQNSQNNFFPQRTLLLMPGEHLFALHCNFLI